MWLGLSALSPSLRRSLFTTSRTSLASPTLSSSHNVAQAGLAEPPRAHPERLTLPVTLV